MGGQVFNNNTTVINLCRSRVWLFRLVLRGRVSLRTWRESCVRERARGVTTQRRLHDKSSATVRGDADTPGKCDCRTFCWRQKPEEVRGGKGHHHHVVNYRHLDVIIKYTRDSSNETILSLIHTRHTYHITIELRRRLLFRFYSREFQEFHWSNESTKVATTGTQPTREIQ